MTSRKFQEFLTPPPPPSVTLKWVFYLHLHIECHKITYPPPPYLCDVIYVKDVKIYSNYQLLAVVLLSD